MKPNFKDIDIIKDAFGEAHAPEAKGEEWLTPELIPVKPVYTKEDLEGLEHLEYVSGIPLPPQPRVGPEGSVRGIRPRHAPRL